MAEKFKVPVEKGKTYTIDIVRLGAGGEGVGRMENFTVFVDGALPRETVTARITYVKSSMPSAGRSAYRRLHLIA